MKQSQEFSFELFADYRQFYIQDGGVCPEVPEKWTDEDVERRAKVGENVVIICPVRNMTVPVCLEVWNSEPPTDLSGADHVVRCSLDLPTGELQVHECTGGERLRLSVRPGTYGVLVLFSGLGTISEDGLEGADTYRVLVWPTSPMPLTVLKAWDESAPAAKGADED